MPMPLWISDFMGSDAVMAFNTAQIGAYLLLLMAQWQSELDRIAAAGVRTITRWRGPEGPLRDVLAEFKSEDGFLFHPKLRRIKADRMKYHGSNESKARNAADTRWNLDEDDCPEEFSEECSEHPSGMHEAMPTKAGEQGEGSISDPEPTGDGNPSTRAGATAGFGEFWSAYPRKVGKASAMKAWLSTAKVRPALGVILAKLEVLKRSRQWTKDGGEYVPFPATWLRRHGWDDEPGPEGPAPSSAKPRNAGSNVSAETDAALAAMRGSGQ